MGKGWKMATSPKHIGARINNTAKQRRENALLSEAASMAASATALRKVLPTDAKAPMARSTQASARDTRPGGCFPTWGESAKRGQKVSVKQTSGATERSTVNRVAGTPGILPSQLIRDDLSFGKGKFEPVNHKAKREYREVARHGEVRSYKVAVAVAE